MAWREMIVAKWGPARKETAEAVQVKSDRGGDQVAIKEREEESAGPGDGWI